MPEALALVLDTSPFMRNGNLAPSRLAQQRSAAEYIIRGKIHSNAENVCSVTAASATPVLLCPMTHEERHLINAVQQCEEGDGFNLVKGIMQARLAVKHRPKKQQTPTIMCFIGSPYNLVAPDAVEKGLRTIARTLRKESVGLIFIVFGEDYPAESIRLLESVVQEADKGDNSRLVRHQSADPYAQLVDTVRRSGILSGEEEGVTGDEDPELADALRQIAAAEGRAYVPVVDNAAGEIDDPELAEAIRLSLMDLERAENGEEPRAEEPRVEEPAGDTVVPATNENGERANVISTTGQIDFNDPKLKEMLSNLGVDVGATGDDAEKKEEEEKKEEGDEGDKTHDEEIKKE